MGIVGGLLGSTYPVAACGHDEDWYVWTTDDGQMNDGWYI